MKRLLAQIGITAFSVLAAAYYLPEVVVWVIGGIALMAAIILLIIKRTRMTVFIPAMALAAAIACAVHIGYGWLVVQPITAAYGDSVHSVEAVLTDEPYQSYSMHYYRLRTTKIDGEKKSVKLLLKTLKDTDAEPDDTLCFTAELKATDNSYYRAKGYYLVSDSFSTVIDIQPAASHSPYYYVIRLRQWMRKALDRYLPDDAASLCKAVLVGDKYALSLDVRDHFRYAGASYFIVVSGMHFAVICLLIWWLVKKLRFKRWIRLTLTLLFMLVYAAVTGFQSSVIRAGVMMAILVIGRTLRRQTYSLNHLGIAGIVMPFLVSPYGAGDIGLILSFYAALAILLWASPIAHKLCIKDAYGSIPLFHPADAIRRWSDDVKERFRRPKTKKRVKKAEKRPVNVRLILIKLWNVIALQLSVSLAANILVFPISVFVFREISLVTVFSAVLLYGEIYCILLLSFFLCLFSWCYPLAVLLSVPLLFLCRLVLWIVESIASLPFAFIRVDAAFIDIWLAATIILGIIVLLCRNGYRFLKPAAFLSAMILLAGALTHELIQSQTLALEVYSCGKGLCAAVNCGGNLHILHAEAKSKYLYEIWDDLSGRYGGADTALCGSERERKNVQMYREDEFAISSVLLYDKGENADTVEPERNFVTFGEDSVFILDDGLTLSAAVSDDLVIPYVTAGDTSILIIPDGCELKDIPVSMRQADVIVLSEASSGMENLRCSDLIISNTADRAQSTAELLHDCYQHVYMTGEGDVTLPLR